MTTVENVGDMIGSALAWRGTTERANESSPKR
jgi:hypothetical protein